MMMLLYEFHLPIKSDVPSLLSHCLFLRILILLMLLILDLLVQCLNINTHTKAICFLWDFDLGRLQRNVPGHAFIIFLRKRRTQYLGIDFVLVQAEITKYSICCFHICMGQGVQNMFWNSMNDPSNT